MKLLRLIASMDPAKGGPVQGIRNLTPALWAQGVETEVVSLDDPDAPFLAGLGLRVHALGPAGGRWSYSSRLMPWLKAHLREYDVVILHGLWQYPGYALRQVVRGLRDAPPYLMYPHGMLDSWFQKEPSRRWKALRNLIYWRLVECRIVADATALLFTCEEEKRLAAGTFARYRPRREITVGYGVPVPPEASAEDRAAFLALCPGLRPDQPYLLFLSRLHAKKGLDLLIRAYGALGDRETLPALVIAGPGGERAFGQDMRKLAAGLAPVELIYFAGMLQDGAKWAAFRGCLAFVLPSHQENFGIAVVEALACGKPVLISNKVNIWQEIAQGGAGLVAPDTLEGTTQLLEQWLADPARWSDQAPMLRCYQSHFAVDQAAAALHRVLVQAAGPDGIP